MIKNSILLLVLLFIASAGAQAGTGPKDGTDLPATELGRVKVGEGAPDFSLAKQDGSLVTLSDYRGEKNVVLVFYRGHW